MSTALFVSELSSVDAVASIVSLPMRVVCVSQEWWVHRDAVKHSHVTRSRAEDCRMRPEMPEHASGWYKLTPGWYNPHSWYKLTLPDAVRSLLSRVVFIAEGNIIVLHTPFWTDWNLLRFWLLVHMYTKFRQDASWHTSTLHCTTWQSIAGHDITWHNAAM